MSRVPCFAVVVPVKPPAVGKSRLAGLPDEQRRELAAAFAVDTVTAVLATPSVVCVVAMTDDFRFAARLRELGCVVLPDGVGDSLNASLVQAAREAERLQPGVSVAAVCADLPALRSEELEAALRLVPPEGSAYVADTTGTGTTMYAAGSVDLFDPRFGPESARAHQDAGAAPLGGELPSLRQDVDDVADLGRALVLGVGERTARAAGR